LSDTFRINTSGNVSLPLIGEIRATGLTPQQFEHIVADNLQKSGFFKDPSVSAEVVAYRPVFVLGEINKPGQYPYQPGMTAVTAVAVAGGFTYRAVQDSFAVVRTINGKAVEGKADRQDFIQPGDVITVFERKF